MSGADVGFVLAFVAAALLTYETVAIRVSWLPTLSRLWQGQRDRGTTSRYVMDTLAVVLGLFLTSFAGWLVWHFVIDGRSTL